MSGNWPGHDKSRGGPDRRGIIPDVHNCKIPGSLSGVTQPDRTVQKTLVERFARGQLQPLDFVLNHQFAALQLDYLQVVCGWMGESLVQFAFQNPMFAFQFNEMRLYCHTKSPRLWDLRFDQDDGVYISLGGCRWVLKIECSHGVLLEMNREGTFRPRPACAGHPADDIPCSLFRIEAFATLRKPVGFQLT
jgi:hypothetical protein